MMSVKNFADGAGRTVASAAKEPAASSNRIGVVVSLINDIASHVSEVNTGTERVSSVRALYLSDS